LSFDGNVELKSYRVEESHIRIINPTLRISEIENVHGEKRKGKKAREERFLDTLVLLRDFKLGIRLAGTSNDRTIHSSVDWNLPEPS